MLQSLAAWLQERYVEYYADSLVDVDVYFTRACGVDLPRGSFVRVRAWREWEGRDLVQYLGRKAGRPKEVCAYWLLYHVLPTHTGTRIAAPGDFFRIDKLLELASGYGVPPVLIIAPWDFAVRPAVHGVPEDECACTCGAGGRGALCRALAVRATRMPTGCVTDRFCCPLARSTTAVSLALSATVALPESAIAGTPPKGSQCRHDSPPAAGRNLSETFHLLEDDGKAKGE